jgi:radical SAM superfamily enzyme YgiQ (UPF0313 family)
MKVVASSFGAWRSIEQNEGVKVPHGLVFSLAVLEALGKPHGLEMVAEEHAAGVNGFDAVFISVIDSRCMTEAAKHFRDWRVPFRRADRRPVGKYPLVWAGGQGLHNPRPMAPALDLCVIGDAEDPLPALLALWHRHGNSAGFLAAAATVPGVFVPDHHDPSETTIVQSVAQDISVTMRHEIDVSHNKTRRLEIARGCQFKCAFCSLGWRTPLRENSAEQIITEIQRSSKLVHLQAGDAESHSGIVTIRAALQQHGGYDQGWTGRYDTLLENPDQSIPGQKRYAFGVEGVSHRLRAAVGKGYLTDERLIDDTCRFFDNLEGDTKGRAAWHVIAGLPTERVSETLDLGRVIAEIDRRRSGKTSRNLSIHWQPFQPLPGTPMQWCAGGTGARKLSARLKPFEGLPWCRVRQVGGRTDEMALVCSVLARADERGADLLEAMEERRVSADEAARIAGVGYGALDPDAPLPWDFVQQHFDRATLRRAYDVMMRRLTARLSSRTM